MKIFYILIWLSSWAIATDCPKPDFTPDKVIVIEQNIGERPIDQTQEIKDLGTDIVTKKFFTSPNTLFNFMKLVYGNLESAIASYKKNKGLEERAIFLVFKGGNIMRMIANEVFKLLPTQSSNLIKSQYDKWYKRSDVDFSVYVDEEKLLNFDYEKILNEVTNLMSLELNKIREKIKSNPKTYFNFFSLKPEEATSELDVFFDELTKIKAIKDATNDKWYQAKFKQLQILNFMAKPDLVCKYFGQFDYKYEIKNNKLTAIRKSDNPNWIYNTENTTIDIPWGSDASKTTKFFLVRSKIAFEYIYDKDGKAYRRPVGGELIDVSLPHKEDSSLRKFLANYDKNIASYILYFSDRSQKLILRSYSPSYLAFDLQNILFNQFDRPWNSGGKYEKRVYRYFFFTILEMLHDYGLGSEEAKKYLSGIREKIINPLKMLYPLNKNLALQIKNNIDTISLKSGNKMAVTNRLWQALGAFLIKQLLENPQADDIAKFKEFLGYIEDNINNATKLSDMPQATVPLKQIFKSGSLF